MRSSAAPSCSTARNGVRLTELRTVLDALSLRPSKALGQNFLHDANLARAIASAAVPEHAPFALEVGPGLGALTAPLLERCGHLLIVEKDTRLAEWLRGRLAGDRAEIACADASDFDWRPLMRHGPFPLVGNLPYCATSPILRNFLGPCSPVSRAVFTVQNEFAARLAAAPGNPDYSALSVRIQRLWTVRRERLLPPSVFYPEPGVNSALVVLERRAPRALAPVRARFFDEIVSRGFSQRRKQLRPLLRVEAHVWSEWCERHGLPPTCRAEDLAVAQWVDLARALDPAAALPPQSEDEPFDVLDENDTRIGTAPRSAVHRDNLLHRAVHILVYNADGELLLQKRSAWKDREPLKWDSSAAGHLEPGEDYAAAALRETGEELGVAPEIERLGKIRACANTGHEFVEVFAARHGGPFVLPPAEIEDAVFFPPQIIGEWIASRPEDFAPAFREIWKLAPH